jgi:tRNA-Thr(GGU) m(6)t(6)A37 methyltransferase TsaA
MEQSQQTFRLTQIGQVKREDGRIYLAIDEPYRPELKQLGHFGYVHVLWWFSRYQDEQHRRVLQSKPPYGEDVPVTGVFASRYPMRPNPIGLTTVQVLGVDAQEGNVEVGNMDAFDGTPIVDLKPYIPLCDRVRETEVPPWIAHWPQWISEGGMGLAQGETG